MARIVDFHTHMFPDKIAASTIEKLSRLARIYPFTEGNAADLFRSMEEAGVSRSVILPVATASRQVAHLNDSAARLNETYGDKGLISFGAMHPDYTEYRAELARIKSLGLKGIKVHPVYQGVDLDDPRFLRIFDRAAELSLIVVTHAGLDVGFPGMVHCSPEMALHTVNEVGPFRFVLAHMGGWRNWKDVLSLLPGTGVYLDTSFSSGQITPLQGPESEAYWNGKDMSLLDKDGMLTLIRAFGADHLLFGSDSPWGGQKETLDFVRSLPLDKEELDLILFKNAEQLLGLD